LRRITRGQPQLRTLRGLMEEVYRLFDRRCRTATALAKLAQLRSRLRRFGRLRTVLKKLFSPNLEKALLFLDEKLLGATSNAVERGNRRYRKMQKTVYRVCGRVVRSRSVWRWTCFVSDRHTAEPRRSRPFTSRGRHDTEARNPCYSVQNPLIFFESAAAVLRSKDWRG
jgi:hypothetical protein